MGEHRRWTIANPSRTFASHSPLTRGTRMKRLGLLALLVAAPVLAQTGAEPAGTPAPARGGRGAGFGMWRGAMDSARVRELYVSKSPADLQGCSPAQCERGLADKHRSDSV